MHIKSKRLLVAWQLTLGCGPSETKKIIPHLWSLFNLSWGDPTLNCQPQAMRENGSTLCCCEVFFLLTCTCTCEGVYSAQVRSTTHYDAHQIVYKYQLKFELRFWMSWGLILVSYYMNSACSQDQVLAYIGTDMFTHSIRKL